MIEAVNSVLSNGAASKNVAAQTSTAKSLSANPDKVQEAARAPYVSPYISVDRRTNQTVLQIRDSDTGDVVRQYPTQGQLKAYQTAQEITTRREAQATENNEAPAAPQVEQTQRQEVSAPEAPQATAVQTDA